MLPHINIVAGCTATKTMPVTPDLQLRSIGFADLIDRAQCWIRRLQTSTEHKVPAADLYAGDAWQIIKPFAKTHGLWIASAGFGLVNSQTLLCSYSATFTKKHPDSVLSKVSPDRVASQSSTWWAELGKWRKRGQSVQTIVDLAKCHPHGSILVVLSPEYVRALEQDLRSAREFLSDPMRLVIISSGARKTGDLADHFLPCDARLQTHLNGGRASLNARIARKVISEMAPDELHMGALKKKFIQLLESSPKVVVHKRLPMNDQSVLSFIRKQLRHNPRWSHSRLLTMLRVEGHACEQSRFKRLFQKVR